MRVQLALCALSLAAAPGCGSESPCLGDFCVPTLTVKWEFNKDVIPDFLGDNCTDRGVSSVDVDLVGGRKLTGTDDCTLRQVVFQDIPTGRYEIRMSPRDAAGELVTTDVVRRLVDFGGGYHEEAIVNVAADEWARAATGTFYFRLQWGGADCAAAVPPVAFHQLELDVNGAPVARSTTTGDPLDGSSSGPCRSLVEGFPQAALSVPFGFARFRVIGFDAGGTAQFEETFQTFVGAGLSNPEMMFDIDSLGNPLPDAAVDPDAGGDAG